MNQPTKYERDFQHLKDWDEVQATLTNHSLGLDKIVTAGHGYYIVPKRHADYSIAKTIAGFIGEHAAYLEEDCEITDFLNQVESNKFMADHFVFARIA